MISQSRNSWIHGLEQVTPSEKCGILWPPRQNIPQSRIQVIRAWYLILTIKNINDPTIFLYLTFLLQLFPFLIINEYVTNYNIIFPYLISEFFISFLHKNIQNQVVNVDIQLKHILLKIEKKNK